MTEYAKLVLAEATCHTIEIREKATGKEFTPDYVITQLSDLLTILPDRKEERLSASTAVRYSRAKSIGCSAWTKAMRLRFLR